ncbi:MAG: CsbD family protein [Caulobacteraceae bacterium]|nr:CsbD family protein [Caulobacteraceae bacterium]
MNENKFEGGAKKEAGKLESLAGEALGDPGLEAEGDGLRFEGELQDAAGSIQQSVGEMADRVKEALAKTRDAYRRMSQAAQDAADKVDPFVREQPFTALCLAAAAGLLVGLLMAGRGSKIVYLKPMR